MMTRRHLIVFALIFLATSAHASGLEVPEQGAHSIARGGAFAAKANNPAAVIHSPGMVSRLKGLQLWYSHNLIWAPASFTPSESAVPTDVAFDGRKSENETPFFGLGASVAATHDFGLERWVFGVSVYGPNSSGALSYDRERGQRYMLTKLEALLAYVGATVAWGTDEFGIGATLQWASLPKLDYSLVVDGTLKEDQNPYRSGFDMEATLRLKDMFAPTAVVGAWWKPAPGWTIAASGRPMPTRFDATGSVALAEIPGTEIEEQFDVSLSETAASMELVLPPTARLGVRWAKVSGDEEIFDIELDLTYEGWSTIDRYKAGLGGQVILAPSGAADAEMMPMPFTYDLVDVTIDKKWRDTFGARIGSTWAVSPKNVELSAGAFVEQAAAPKNYTHLDFVSQDRLGLGTGVTGYLSLGEAELEMTLAYLHVFQKSVTVDERYGKVVQQRPITPCPEFCRDFDGIPANAGTFESSFDIVSVSITTRL